MSEDSTSPPPAPPPDLQRAEILLRDQNRLRAEMAASLALTTCLLEKIGRIGCMTANEVHRNGIELKAIRHAVEALLDLYRTANPAAALEADRLSKLRAQIERCCPPEQTCATICTYEPCELPGGRGDGWSTKSRGRVELRETGERHPPWQFVERPRHTGEKTLPRVPPGAFTGLLSPSAPTPLPQDFRGGGPTPPGAQAPVGFRTFTQTELADTSPPDMSGARGGDVVLMSGNLWLKLSVDGGATFIDLDFTKIFEQDKVYGGWAGDQVIHYIPAIDCFVLYVQSFQGTEKKPDGTANPEFNKNVVKVALASQSDLKKFTGGKPAWWRQWDFTSDTFGLGSAWMDFPDMTYGINFLHINTNVYAGKSGKLFFELPLSEMLAGKGFGFLFAFDASYPGSPAQNVEGDDFYWAGHVSDSGIRIYSSRGGDPNFAWRERTLNGWPRDKSDDGKKFEDNVISKAPDSPTGSARTIGSSARPEPEGSCGSHGLPLTATVVTAASSSRIRTFRSPSSTSLRTLNVSTRCKSGMPIMPMPIRALPPIRTAKWGSHWLGAAAPPYTAATRWEFLATSSSGMAQRVTRQFCVKARTMPVTRPSSRGSATISMCGSRIPTPAISAPLAMRFWRTLR